MEKISPVTFPAKVNANITKVKAITKANTERELEKALRESGLSKADAQYVVKLSKPSLRESEEKEEEKDLESKDLKGIIESDVISPFTGAKHEDLKSEAQKEVEEFVNLHKDDYNQILSKLQKINTEIKVHTLCT